MHQELLEFLITILQKDFFNREQMLVRKLRQEYLTIRTPYLLLIGIVQELQKREEEILIMVIKKHLQQVKHPQVMQFMENPQPYNLHHK